MLILRNVNVMAKLFQKKESTDLRSIRYPILLTQKEAEEIRHSANIRNLSVAEFIRRAALGRKADVRYETEIVLQLSDAVRAIRAIHKAMVDMQIKPPEEIWGPIMDAAEAAMLRIDA